MNKFERISEAQFKKDQMGTQYGAVYSGIQLPKRATKHSAGYDFFAPCDFTLQPGMSIKIPTGIKVQLDEDKVLALLPRSSFGFKYKMHLDNSVGVIDADYYNNPDNEGHIWVSMTNMSADRVMQVKKGDKFIQGLILTYGLTDDDQADATRMGGMGSSDK